MLQLNLGRNERCDNVIVVTHGLTMRLILMQLYQWSPNTFHTIWNARNCEMYVLRKDPAAGRVRYILDRQQGDYPQSSLEVDVHFKDGRPCKRVVRQRAVHVLQCDLPAVHMTRSSGQCYFVRI